MRTQLRLAVVCGLAAMMWFGAAFAGVAAGDVELGSDVSGAVKDAGTVGVPKGTVTVLSEGFEMAFPGANGWTIGDADLSGTPAYWKDVNSTFGGESTHLGAWKGYCAGNGYAGTVGAPLYRDSMRAYMKRNIDLTGASSATLSFWYKIPSIESNVDVADVYVGNNLVWSRTSSRAAWTQSSVSLTPYVGAVRELKFQFESDLSTTAEGWYLDDIEVTKVEAGALSVRISPLRATTYGARWRVDGGGWQNSSTTVSNLSVGTHTVSFQEAGGGSTWVTPADQTVTITAGATALTTGYYIECPYASCTFPVSFPGKEVLFVKYDLKDNVLASTTTLFSPSEISIDELKPNRWYWVAFDVKDGAGVWRIAFATYIARLEGNTGRWIGALPTTLAVAPYDVDPPTLWLWLANTANHACITCAYDCSAAQMVWGAWQQNPTDWVPYRVPLFDHWYYVYVADSVQGMWY